MEINENEANKMIDFINDLDDEQRLLFLNELIEKGIPIHQAPFWGNVDINKLSDLYDKYNIEESICNGIDNKLIIAEEYFMRLKHEPSDKFSARSTSINNLKDLPSKGRIYKDSKDVYSKTPIRIGEMEITNLSLTRNIEDIKELLDSYANNPKDRENLICQCLLDDPFDINFESSGTESNNVKTIKTLLKSIGIDLEN